MLLGFPPESGQRRPAHTDGDGLIQSVAGVPIWERKGGPAKLAEQMAGRFGRVQLKLRIDKLGRYSPAKGAAVSNCHVRPVVMPELCGTSRSS